MCRIDKTRKSDTISTDQRMIYIFFQVYCHLRTSWFGTVIKKLGAHLAELLEEYLEEIHYSIRVTTDIGNLLHAIEKYFGGTTNYAEVKGSMFMDFMCRYHRTAYLYPVYQACGRSHQDIGIEGAVAALMT